MAVATFGFFTFLVVVVTSMILVAVVVMMVVLVALRIEAVFTVVCLLDYHFFVFTVLFFYL